MSDGALRHACHTTSDESSLRVLVDLFHADELLEDVRDILQLVALNDETVGSGCDAAHFSAPAFVDIEICQHVAHLRSHVFGHGRREDDAQAIATRDIVNETLLAHFPQVRIQLDLWLDKADTVDSGKHNSVGRVGCDDNLCYHVVIFHASGVNGRIAHLLYLVVEEAIEMSVVLIDIERILCAQPYRTCK